MANETVEQYVARILRLQSGGDPNRILAETPGKIGKLIRGRSRAQLTKRPSPKQWSVSEIVAHLADAELVIGYRARSILGNPGTPIQAYDQDVWARVFRYKEREVRASLNLFAALRTANLALWKSVTRSQWKLFGVHSERGKETLERIWRHNAGHDLNHLNQIVAILHDKRRANS